jgi:SAM-dependent methyltransferase
VSTSAEPTRAPGLPPAEDFVLGPYPRRYCTVCEKTRTSAFKPGPGGRPDVRCPGCGSLERHRFLAVLLDLLAPSLGQIGVLLDVAPSPQSTPLLRRLAPRAHVRLDLGADNRLVDVLGSLTQLPLPDASVDLLVCYHVLEHVPDDRAAMREIARVLGDNGIGLLQVPHRPGTLTDEDPSAGPEERLRRFGQADHVRWYGDDLEDRLVESGLSVQRLTPRSVIGDEMSAWLKLRPDEMSWLVRPASDATVPPRVEPLPTVLTATLDALVAELADQHGRLLRTRERVEGLRRKRANLSERVQALQAENARLGAASRPVWRRAAGRLKREAASRFRRRD